MTIRNLFNSRTFLLFILIPLFNVTSFQYIPSLKGVYNIIQLWKLVSLLIIIFLYCIRRRFTLIVLIIVAFEVVNIIASLANGVTDSKVFTNALLGLGFAMMTEFAIFINWELFKKNLFRVLLILISINFVLCLIYPDGLSIATLYSNNANPMYFLGIDNGMIRALLPLLVVTFYRKIGDEVGVSVRNQSKKNNLEIMSVCLICLVTLFIVNSSTGIVVGLFYIFSIVLFNIILKKKFPWKLMIGIYLLFFIGIIIMGTNIGVVTAITGMFGKSGTFTGRTLLWIEALSMIQSRPLIGYGYTSGNISIWGGMMSSHNLFLELIIQGGIFSLIVFVWATTYAILNIRQAGYKSYNILTIGILCYLLIGLMEAKVSEEYFMLLILCCYPNLEKSKDMKVFNIR